MSGETLSGGHGLPILSVCRHHHTILFDAIKILLFELRSLNFLKIDNDYKQ
jgi:hypothetical protein